MPAPTAAPKDNPSDELTRYYLVEYLRLASIWVQLGVELKRVSRFLAGLAEATDG